MSKLSHINFALTVIAAQAIKDGQAIAVDGHIATEGGPCLGFVSYDAEAGEAVSAGIKGLLVGIAGAAITKGADLAIGPNGTVVPAAGTARVIGTAFESVAAGKFVQVLK